MVRALAHTGSVVRLGLAIGLATLLAVGPGCYRELKQNGKRLWHAPSSLPAVLGNLPGLLRLLPLSVAIFNGNRLAMPWTGACSSPGA